MTTAIYVAALAAGVVSLVLFFLALRRQGAVAESHLHEVERHLREQDERIAARFATFAQALNDGLAAVAARSELAADESLTELSGHESLCRMLEVSRERIAADAAIAVVTPGTGTPILAMVGMSAEEADEVVQMRFQNANGARAIQISFNGSAAAPPTGHAIRSGLAVALLDTPEPPSMLAVFTRAEDRQFTDEDIEALEEVARTARSQLELSFGLRPPDVVLELDPLSALIDATAFETLVEREIYRARMAGQDLALVLADIDRLTTINAQAGTQAGDAVIAEAGRRLLEAIGHEGFAARLLGGRYGLLLPGGDAELADEIFRRIRGALAERPIEPVGTVSMSAGVAELQIRDDVESLIDRAEIALRAAKGLGKGAISGATRAA